MLRPTCSQKLGSLIHFFGLYWLGGGGPLVRGSCEGGARLGDGGGCRHPRDSQLLPSPLSSPLLSLPSSLLSLLWSVGRWPLAAHHACHDGSGPHASGRSGRGVSG
jgi:hypothetical protein